jgi:hypothetical protein
MSSLTIQTIVRSQYILLSHNFQKRTNNNNKSHYNIIMKIYTKQCTPINKKNKGAPSLEEAILHPNKYIFREESKKQDNNDATATYSSDSSDEDTPTGCGRELKYIPTIVYTPVLTSKRTPDNRRLLDDKDVEELNQKLAELLLKSKEVKKEAEKEDMDISIHNKKESPSLFGRIYNTVFSYNTCKSSPVLRSARLAPVAQA